MRSPLGSSLILTPSADGMQQVTGPGKLDYPSCCPEECGRFPNENGWSGECWALKCTEPRVALQRGPSWNHPPPSPTPAALQVPLSQELER